MLSALVLRHAQSIAFENLDPFLGRSVSLDPQAVETKLVQQHRGGWCFEQNLLLGEALRALGFVVQDLAGRVLWNRPPDAVTARSHRLLRVSAANGDWLVDAGFGGHTLTGVLDLDSEAPQQTSHEPFRLRRIADGERVLESMIGAEWKPLCRFDLQPQQPVDFEAVNYQLAHDPASHFTQVLIVSKVADDGRHVLHGRELAFHRRGGETSRRELRSAGEVLEVLQDVFGLRLDEATRAALSARLAAQAGSAARS